MPVCETCGHVATREELTLDSAVDRTTCSRCRVVGPVAKERYRVASVFTEDGLELSVKAPNTEFSFRSSWADIVNTFRGEER
jgi:RNase P subunit RPR2